MNAALIPLPWPDTAVGLLNTEYINLAFKDTQLQQATPSDVIITFNCTDLTVFDFIFYFLLNQKSLRLYRLVTWWM